ncbi:MAG TPA: FtsX-like permease family protein [Bdellovibrio sp.]|uniref:ABC transporter permease n=1 Tax=Bdellovibrio sp. TaxID=28201 RepID=UPI002F0CECD6
MVFLAAKHLMARKKQSLVTLLGIFIGTLAFIMISGFFSAQQNYMIDMMVSGDAHIKIQARERLIIKEEVEKFLFPEYKNFVWLRAPAGRRAAAAIENPPGWYERFKDYTEVVAATSVYTATGLLSNNGTNYSLSITGAKPSEQVKITNIASKIIKGNYLDLEKGTGSIVVGKELASDFAKEVGDTITLTTTDGRQLPFKIVAIFSTGERRAEISQAYTTLTDAQKIGNVSGQISQISVKVKNFRDASKLADSWKATSYDSVQSWDQLNSQLLQMFTTQDMTQYLVTGVIMLVAGFGIYNILNMVVTQKRKDIAILRSMGYESKDIIRLFLLQGALLGLTGGLLGCLASFLFSKALGDIHMGGPFSGATMTIDFNIYTYLQALLISNGAALLASYLPSRNASKLTPIEIIRSGAE